MKKIRLSACCLFLTASFASATYALPQTYTIDPLHTAVTWHVSHFGFSNPSGKWYANGTMVLDDANPSTASVKVNIDIAKLVTGIPKLDYNLLGSAFLDDVRYPKATFVSTKLVMLDKTKGELTGNLTLHGVTKPVVLSFVYNKIGIDPITKKQTIGFSATTIIQRSDYGITTYVPSIGDDVKLDIEVEAELNSK